MPIINEEKNFSRSTPQHDDNEYLYVNNLYCYDK
jgi:hypothetical protein